MTKQELTYWVTLALMPRIWTRRKNEIYVNAYNRNLSIIDLFENSSTWNELGISDTEAEEFTKAHQQLVNNSFLIEDMLSQGYEIFPIDSNEYPKTLKHNLGKNSPTVIFTKGDNNILQQPAVAIVGSRKAYNISLQFTDNVAKKSAEANQIVVSGFAKGVDRQALDSSIEAGGKSIIVLPQGILTFASGFKQYYQYIVQGRILVMSSFAPNAPWSKEFAMARNPIIYGMASTIFVAQSDDKGGTWSGVIDGLRRNRTIYVRWPEATENNANKLLVQKGAHPVDINGNTVKLMDDDTKSSEQKESEEIKVQIIELLTPSKIISSKDIISKLGIDWSDAKMKRYLEKIPSIEKRKIKNKIYYGLKGQSPNMLAFNFE